VFEHVYDMPEWTIFEAGDFGDVSEPSREQVLDALVDICGPDYARVGRSVDAVAGRPAGFVAVPATTRAAAYTMQLAADHGLVTMPRGSGSKIDWGVPADGVDLLVDTGRLSGMWHHDVAGQTAEVGTGTPVRALQAALALRGQRLPVDPPSRSATVGGMLAVNESGPLRHRFGTPAEHVDRVTYVDRAGQPAESDGEGGRPGIAEIAGVVISAKVRLQPLPPARRWVGVAVPSPLQIPKLAGEVADLEPSAIEVDLPADAPAGTLAVLLEGDEESVATRAERLAGAWGAGSAVAAVAPPWWGRYPFERSDVALRLSVSPADLPAALYALGDAAGAPVPVRGSAGLGTVHAVLPGSTAPDRVERILDGVRHVLMARNGRAVVVSAPIYLARQIEMAARRDLF
jgi:glycolate oxidase FAD binding subunit